MWQGGSRLALLRLPHARVNDGAWHHLQLELRGDPGRAPPTTLLLLALDYGRHQVWGGGTGRAVGWGPPAAVELSAPLPRRRRLTWPGGCRGCGCGR